MKYGVLGLTMGLLVLGCSSDPEGGGAGGTGGSGGQGAGGGDGCETVADPSVTDVTGRWAYLEVGSQLTKAPAFAEPFHTVIVSVLILDQTQTGENVTVTGEYCDHYTEDPDAAVHAVIPDAYRESLKPVSRAGTFGADGRYHLARLPEIVGAQLADPAEDLPTTPDDPRLIDEDMDGQPGVTIRLTGLVDGEVYVVERKLTELQGVAVSAERLEGLLTFSSEQSVVASDPPSIKTSTDATQTLVDQDACNSYFRMVRIAADADCASVVANMDTLFP